MIQDTRLSKILKYKIFKYYSQVKIFKILFMCTQFFIKIRIFWFEKVIWKRLNWKRFQNNKNFIAMNTLNIVNFINN